MPYPQNPGASFERLAGRRLAGHPTFGALLGGRKDMEIALDFSSPRLDRVLFIGGPLQPGDPFKHAGAVVFPVSVLGSGSVCCGVLKCLATGCGHPQYGVLFREDETPLRNTVPFLPVAFSSGLPSRARSPWSFSSPMSVGPLQKESSRRSTKSMFQNFQCTFQGKHDQRMYEYPMKTNHLLIQYIFWSSLEPPRLQSISQHQFSQGRKAPGVGITKRKQAFESCLGPD